MKKLNKTLLLFTCFSALLVAGCSDPKATAIAKTIEACQMVEGQAKLETKITLLFSSVTATCEWKAKKK